MNQQLDELIKGFRPRFGNVGDIALVAQIGKVRKLQESVGKHEQRVKSLTRLVLKQTENQKRLQRAEGSLLTSLRNRNGTA